MDVELYVRSGSMTTAAGIARLTGRNCYKRRMNTYKRHRFSPDIISYAVWLYFGSNLSHRGYGDTYNIDEVYVKINGKQQYLWRAVSQEGLPHERSECFGYGETVEVYLRVKRDGAVASRFFRRLIRGHKGEPRRIVTDQVRSYGVAHREPIPEAIHITKQYENNRADQSHEATRVREPGMRRPRYLGTGCLAPQGFNLSKP